MSEFFAMGGHAFFVWGAYGVSAIVLAGVALVSLAAARRARRALEEAERTAPRRRA